MSGSPAGRFQDHYALLGVDPKADLSIIQQAYAKLAQRYQPKNEETGDAEKFEAVNIAYEVLSDPELRTSFDKIKGVGEELGTPKFSGPEFFNALVRERELRMTVMSILYDRRRIKPFTPSLSMRHLESMLQAAPEEIVFTLWYLKQRRFVANDDKSSLQITVDGMDYLEANRPSEEIVMNFLRPDALPKAAAAPASPQPIKSVRPLSKSAEPNPSMMKINLALASSKRRS